MQLKFYSSISCVPVAWFHYGAIHLFLWAPREAHMNKHESIFLPNAKGHDGASSSLTDHLPLINRTQNGLQPSILCPMSTLLCHAPVTVCEMFNVSAKTMNDLRKATNVIVLKQSCKCNLNKTALIEHANMYRIN